VVAARPDGALTADDQAAIAGLAHTLARVSRVSAVRDAGQSADGRAEQVGHALRLAGELQVGGNREQPPGAFRGVSGMSWRDLLRQGLAMRRESALTMGRVLMAANTPVLLRAAMVEGRTDLGLMSSGQVAGLIGDLPSCAELIAAIVRDAEAGLDTMATFRSE